MTGPIPHGSTPHDTRPDPLSPDVLREQRLQRNLKILVIGLGVLIFAGLAAVIGRIAYMATRPKDSAAVTTALSAPAGGQIALEVPKGAKIISVSLSGSRLAVHHDGPDGVGIAVIDLDTGRRIADVKPLEAVPRKP